MAVTTKAAGCIVPIMSPRRLLNGKCQACSRVLLISVLAYSRWCSTSESKFKSRVPRNEVRCPPQSPKQDPLGSFNVQPHGTVGSHDQGRHEQRTAGFTQACSRSSQKSALRCCPPEKVCMLRLASENAARWCGSRQGVPLSIEECEHPTLKFEVQVSS